jgi:hypothetical protein
MDVSRYDLLNFTIICLNTYTCKYSWGSLPRQEIFERLHLATNYDAWQFRKLFKKDSRSLQKYSSR